MPELNYDNNVLETHCSIPRSISVGRFKNFASEWVDVLDDKIAKSWIQKKKQQLNSE